MSYTPIGLMLSLTKQDAPGVFQEALVPDADINAYVWLPTPLYSRINDNDQATYIYSYDASPGSLVVGLSDPVGIPDSQFEHKLAWSACSPSAYAVTMKAELYCGATLVCSDTQVIAETMTAYEHVLTSSEIALITDYSDLKVHIYIVSVV
jgi:hypothetical protein